MQVAALRTRRADQSWPARPAQAKKELLMYAKRNRLGGRFVLNLDRYKRGVTDFSDAGVPRAGWSFLNVAKAQVLDFHVVIHAVV